MIAEIHRLGASLHREVRRAGGELDPDQAARLLLRAQGTIGTAARQVILSLARTDARLDIDDRGMLILARAPALDLALTRVEFVVVDVETTGTRAGAARLTEVGAVRVRDGRCLDTFARLVDPGLPVPSAITRLTGISAAMLQGAPPFARIAVEWLDFLGNGVLVAHNAPFDCSFLNHELIRCGEVPPPNPVLCSVRLARRLLPHLRSHCLDSVARHLGLRFRQRHRALGDAEVTAQLLLVLLERASAHGLTTLGELQELLARPVPTAHAGAEDMQEARPEI